MCAKRPVDRACWEGPRTGRIDLTRDWEEETPPPVELPEEHKQGSALVMSRELPLEYAKMSGYAIDGEWVTFVAPLTLPEEKIYLAAEWNGWADAIGKKHWEMKPEREGKWAMLTVTADLLQGGRMFKFVNDKGVWHEPVFNTPNVVYSQGAKNFAIDYDRTGRHVWRFELKGKANWCNLNELRWAGELKLPLWPGRGFYQLKTDAPLGAIIEGANRTRFALWAPRATAVEVLYTEPSSRQDTRLSLAQEADGRWTTVVPQNLEGYLYHYHIDGPHWEHTQFDPLQTVSDPWALAMYKGRSVVVDKKKLLKTSPAPLPHVPAMEDLIIVEAHVRDVLAQAPLEMEPVARQGLAGLAQLAAWPDRRVPWRSLSANAVELQPLTEYDGNPEDYHWGYMPQNYFAPASGYASKPEAVSQLREMQQAVEALHKAGVAVIADVVMNHLGIPTNLLFLDKAYYFRMNAEGGLTNWSGCGNDLRVESAMTERLLMEALEHWVSVYGVDGFRFDLAELLGVPFLKRAEARLRKIKPDIILIAEPWSFRGHIAAELKDTGYASWNDGFREFVPNYLANRADVRTAMYYIGGSVGGVALKPSQSVNYVESHDDRTWIDKTTENHAHQGQHPTPADEQRSRLMASLMVMSLGVPMWAAGAQALRSKQGVNNTYQRGDLNAIDYSRDERYPMTSEYIRGLCAFRQSPQGRALRVSQSDAGYLQYYEVPGSNALAVVYNANKKINAPRLMYAINPGAPAVVELPGWQPECWQLVADADRVEPQGLTSSALDWQGTRLILPAACAGIWVEKD